MIGLCFRYHEALLYAKNVLNSGRIGRLVSIRSLMGENFPAIHPEYREMYLSKYSGAFDLVHDIDLAIWYANQEVVQAQGIYGAFSDHDFESPDTVELLMKFKDKCVASVHLDFFQTPRRRQMELIGTNGVITVDFASWDKAVIAIHEDDGKAIKTEDIHFATSRNDMFIAESKEFLDCALDNLPVRCTIAEALKSLRVVEQVYKP